MSNTDWRERIRAEEEALRARLDAFGWRPSYEMHRDGIEVEGHETVGDYHSTERRTYLRLHECPRCAAQVEDREKHTDWHDRLGA